VKISSTKIDILQEIGNIGVGNAATALAHLLQTKVNMRVPRATFLDLKEAITLIGGVEKQVVCVNLRVEGDVPATILYIFDQPSACALVDLLLGQKRGTTTALDEMGYSAVMEIGNIMTGSFTGAIAEMTGLQLVPSVPALAHDMLGAIFATAVAASGYAEDQVLCIQTSFVGMQNQDRMDSHFIMLPEVESLDRLFAALGVVTETQVSGVDCNRM
jgi:chemotaxis protein CheC